MVYCTRNGSPNQCAQQDRDIDCGEHRVLASTERALESVSGADIDSAGDTMPTDASGSGGYLWDVTYGSQRVAGTAQAALEIGKK